MHEDTLYAPATAAGPGGVAVVRLSGSSAGEALEVLIGRARPEPRRMALATLRDPVDGEALDQALVVWFPAPASFTGEDVVELHLHGGRAVTAGVLDALAAMEGLRLAEPGEFSRRAFENHRMDLTEVEGLADLVAAETAAQRRQALAQMGGSLGSLYDDWRRRVIETMALQEATIDFADEDLPGGLEDQVRQALETLSQEINAHLADDRRGERLRDGIHVAIVGAPNAGKSSLLNRLAQRDVAIVSEQAGTTRDVVEVHLDLGGFPVILSDTAGLRATDDSIEREGVRRARARAAEADLVIAVLDGAGWPAVETETLDWAKSGGLVVLNKIDLISGSQPQDVGGIEINALSTVSGEGMTELLAALKAQVESRWAAAAAGAPALTRARHREALTECRDALTRAQAGDESELAAEDLRLAARALGRITGRVDVEDVLDVIFADFCIGK